jgi:hypothetical protein
MNGTVNVTVVSTPLTVVAITPTAPNAGTITGAVNSSQLLGVRVSFDDGSFVADMVASAASLGFPAHALLLFASNDTANLGVTANGSVVLKGNSWWAADLSVATACSPLVTASTSAWGNLQPQALDVDLGSLTPCPLGECHRQLVPSSGQCTPTRAAATSSRSRLLSPTTGPC